MFENALQTSKMSLQIGTEALLHDVNSAVPGIVLFITYDSFNLEMDLVFLGKHLEICLKSI